MKDHRGVSRGGAESEAGQDVIMRDGDSSEPRTADDDEHMADATMDENTFPLRRRSARVKRRRLLSLSTDKEQQQEEVHVGNHQEAAIPRTGRSKRRRVLRSEKETQTRTAKPTETSEPAFHNNPKPNGSILPSRVSEKGVNVEAINGQRKQRKGTAVKGDSHRAPLVTTRVDAVSETTHAFQKHAYLTNHSHTTVVLNASAVFVMLLFELALVSLSTRPGVQIDSSRYLQLILVPVCLCVIPLITGIKIPLLTRQKTYYRCFHHIIPPPHVPTHEPHDSSALTDTTLRDFLAYPEGFHLGLAPAFFGFYAYFGALTAWGENVELPATDSSPKRNCLESQILSVAGASAGAMSAVLLAADVHPRRAAEFCRSITLSTFADPPGIGAAFKGNLFEELMQTFMEREKPGHSLLLQDGHIPVAVSAFDIKTMREHLLCTGSMAKAARSSATFPLLFQPCQWQKDQASSAWFIDGGVTDTCGLNGLAVSHPQETKRIVNLVVGNFPPGGAPSPSSMPKGIKASEVLSISIRNTPRCGPWAMANGPKAHEAARLAMIAALDLPLYKGKEAGHYELHLDAGSFVPPMNEP